MADRRGAMEGALPAKRARLDSFNNTEDESSKSSDNKFSSVSESFTGGGESTLTSDSGFNEFTPPQSIEDVTNAACSSQTYSFERKDFVDKREDDLLRNNSLNADDDVDDTCSVGSTASNISGLSDFSGKDWKPCAGPMSWVQQQMEKGVNPRSVLTQILGGSWQVPQGVSDFMLWHIIINMLSEPPKRERLRHINTIDDVIRLIKVCKKIIVLTGAGVSVSCGIPDFRSKDGIYARLSVDFPDLPDPQAMFDINYFRRDPRPFFKFAREIYPGQFTPSLCHRFIRLMEQNNKLLRNYTQNIDTLEQEADIKNVIQCHGSFATATCQICSYKVEATVIKEDVFSQRIPMCPLCLSSGSLGIENGKAYSSEIESRSSGDDSSVRSRISSNRGSFVLNPVSSTSSDDHLCAGESAAIHDDSLIKNSAPPSDPVMKPDIVFFGEGLPDEFHDRMSEDKDECDLLIVIGSSLKVRPVALIPSSIPPHVPQILINREPLNHLTFDVELLGDCDVIVNELCKRLGDSWKALSTGVPLSEIQELPPRSSETSEADGAKSPPSSTPQEAPHPKDESDIEALRACWAPKVKESMAARLPNDKYLFCGGHRYVFPGAEVYYDPDDEDDDDDTQSKSSDSDTEEVDDVEPLSVNTSCEDTQQIYSRRSSQALSEDVDSLLSTASCDPVNNTPDYTSEGNWGSLDTLGGDLGPLNCSSNSLGGDFINPNSTPNRSVGDWTSLNTSLGSDTSSKHFEADHFELTSEGKIKENLDRPLKSDERPKENLVRPQSTRCPV